MADLTHVRIDEIDAIDGVLEGIKMHRAAAGLGVSSFGISIVDLAPGGPNTPSTTTPRTAWAAECSPNAPSSLAKRRFT